VVSQRLLPRADGNGRVACFEVMHSTPAIRNLIRENKIFQIPGNMQTNRKEGMITMDQALTEAAAKGLITKETALEFAENKAATETRLGRSAGNVDKVFRW